MAEEIKYRYCMTCRVRYKSTGEPNQLCTKCGALLADTPTGARTPAPASAGKTVLGVPAPSARVPAPAPAPVAPAATVEEPVEKEVGKKAEAGEFTCSVGDVLLCLLHNLLTGIPVIGLFWCGFSMFKNPLKGRVSKGTIVAGLVANVFSLLLLVLFGTVLNI